MLSSQAGGKKVDLENGREKADIGGFPGIHACCCRGTQNHRTAQVGRDLQRSARLTLCGKGA